VLIAANRAPHSLPDRAARIPGRGLLGASNPMAWGVTLSALLAVLLALYWPWLAAALKLAALPPQALAVALGCGVVGWPMILLIRLVMRWMRRQFDLTAAPSAHHIKPG